MSSNRAVWKFTIPQGASPAAVAVDMPIGAEIIHFGQQGDVPVVWAIVDPDETQTETHDILVAPTGERIVGPGFYLGTTFLHGGTVVVHGFEIGDGRPFSVPLEQTLAEFGLLGEQPDARPG